MMNNYNCLNSSQTTWLKKWSIGNVGSPHETTTSRFKSFWLSTMALLLLMISQSGWSQVSGYAFSQSTGTYTEITGGTVYSTTVATTLDSEVYGNLPIGFTFTYNGVGYTQFGINANGWISMGATTPTSSSAPLSSGTTNNVISALAGDLFGRQFVTASTTLGSPTVTMTAGSLLGVSVGDAVTGTGIATGSTVVSISGSNVTLSLNAVSTGTGRNIRFHNGTIRYQTIGTAPNRQLVVQFKNFSRWATGAPSDFLNFQIVLNETSNRVDLIYNIPYVNASQTREVGLRGSANTDFNNRSTTTNWDATTAGGTNAASCTISNTIFPVSGKTFSFTPPLCVLPGSTTVSGITTTGATVSWLAPSPVPSGGYDYELRTSGAAGSGATGLVTSGNTASLSQAFSSLTPVTSYSFYVRSNCGVDGVTSWRAATNFTTLCNSITVFPWTENFESVTTPALPAPPLVVPAS